MRVRASATQTKANSKRKGASARTPFARRLHSLRIAIRYSRAKFARVMGIVTATYDSLMKGKRPSIYQVRRLQLMERAFKERLDEYHADQKKFNWWGKEEKVYEKWEGFNYKKRMVKFRSSNLLPARKADIEALGGLEVFGLRAGKKARSVAGRRMDGEDEGQSCGPDPQIS